MVSIRQRIKNLGARISASKANVQKVLKTAPKGLPAGTQKGFAPLALPGAAKVLSGARRAASVAGRALKLATSFTGGPRALKLAATGVLGYNIAKAGATGRISDLVPSARQVGGVIGSGASLPASLVGSAAGTAQVTRDKFFAGARNVLDRFLPMSRATAEELIANLRKDPVGNATQPGFDDVHVNVQAPPAPNYYGGSTIVEGPSITPSVSVSGGGDGGASWLPLILSALGGGVVGAVVGRRRKKKKKRKRKYKKGRLVKETETYG